MKPYVKRNKTDAADAEAIAEAVTRPTMRFVSVKSAEQQAALMLHRVRELLVRQRTMLATALRAHLVEFGIIAPQGIHRVEKLAAEVNDPAVPPLAREALMLLVDELSSIWRRIDALEKRLVALHRADEVSRRLASIPGVGPITAMAIANTVPDPSMFRSGREFAAWLGLTPKSHSSGGKDRLADLEARQPLHPAPALRWRRQRNPLHEGARCNRRGLDPGPSGASTAKGRHHRPRQQDGAYCLGIDGPWTELSLAAWAFASAAVVSIKPRRVSNVSWSSPTRGPTAARSRRTSF